jgi:predicted alpha/beta superfamily hydrolase
MRRRAAPLALTLTALAAAHAPAAAQTAQRAAPADGQAITIGTTHTVRSARLGAERTVLVSLPDEYERSPETRYPVLVLLDADDHFRGTVGIVRFFASRGEMPGMIVLGVTNRGGDRTRDFMPRATGADTARFPTAGGADAFVGFLADELLPWADRRYRTLPMRVLAGHSFGGVTALHAAVTRPGAFRIVVGMSPSLWWNDSTSARDYAERVRADTGTRTVIVTSGGREPAIDAPTGRFAGLVDARRPGGLTFRHLRFPNEGHGTTPFVSFVDALRLAFAPLALPLDSVGAALRGPPPKDSAAFAEAREALERRYAAAATRLALPTAFPEGVLNQFGYAALQAGHRNLAVTAFRDNVRRYPNSANTYDSLGDGLDAAGDRAGAIAAYRKAVETAQRTGDPVGPISRGKLEKLERGK